MSRRETSSAEAGATGISPSATEMSPLLRQIGSRVSRVVGGRGVRELRRRIHEWRRRLAGLPHRIDYFHQVDDPYAHLAVQALAPLAERYAVEIRPHLVRLYEGPNHPEPALLARLARRDAALVAPHYGLDAPSRGADAAAPARADVALAESVLAAAAPDRFGALAAKLGTALWSGDRSAIEALAREHGHSEQAATESRLDEGDALRSKLGHYSSATFHYAGEWYWGVDRLCHLEARLRGLGATRGDAELRFPRPPIPMDPVPRASELKLEIFPSLRSPYTAIGFEPAVELARRTGVELVVRPVLPMVMRGVPVTMTKGLYIFRDTLREAELLGVPFGRMLDPIGEPVRRGFALWPFARDAGRGAEYIASFLRAAFAEGRPTWTEAGLRQIVTEAGLSWADAQAHLRDDAWEAELEENRLALYREMGLWGVPSFRLTGPASEPALAVWGQDRLWLLAREIQRRGC